ncbi:MAG: hypothetical protein AAGK78_16385, partial [Planctomycetota bacterium]
MLFTRQHITKTQRGLWLRDGDLRKVLRPGTYFVPGKLWLGPAEAVTVFDIVENPRFRHARETALLKEPALREHLRIVELGETQRAIVWLDGRVIDVVGQGVAGFWEDAGELKVEVFDVTAVAFEHPLSKRLLRDPFVRKHMTVADVGENQRGLVSLDGQLFDVLEPGRYGFWRDAGDVALSVLDIGDARFALRVSDHLLKNELLRKHLHVIELTDTQRTVVWLDGRVIDIVGAGTFGYWRAAGTLYVETFDVTDVKLTHADVQAIAGHEKAGDWLKVFR